MNNHKVKTIQFIYDDGSIGTFIPNNINENNIIDNLSYIFCKDNISINGMVLFVAKNDGSLSLITSDYETAKKAEDRLSKLIYNMEK